MADSNEPQSEQANCEAQNSASSLSESQTTKPSTTRQTTELSTTITTTTTITPPIDVLAPSNDDDNDTLIIKDLLVYMLDLVTEALAIEPIEIIDRKEDNDIEIIDLGDDNEETERINPFDLIKKCAVCKSQKVKFDLYISDILKHFCSKECIALIEQFNACSSCPSFIKKDGKGFMSNYGGKNRYFCSEQCLNKFDLANQPQTYCYNCNQILTKKQIVYYWQTMEFCSKECIDATQIQQGHKCTQCHTLVNSKSMGKYSVRFGDVIKQFCAAICLENYKKLLKVCAFCQRNLKLCSNACKTTFGAGESMKVREFCDPICKSHYELMLTSKNSPRIKCEECKKQAETKTIMNISLGPVDHKFCSPICLAAFKYRHKTDLKFCDNCFADLTYHWEQNLAKQYVHLHYSGFTKLFCGKKCMSMFVLKNRKIVSCFICKVKKYNFDLIEQFNWVTKDSKVFCSLFCLNNGLENWRKKNRELINCHECKQMANCPVRLKVCGESKGFCCIKCVYSFQQKSDKSESSGYRFSDVTSLKVETDTNETNNVNGLSSPSSTMWSPSITKQITVPTTSKVISTVPPSTIPKTIPKTIIRNPTVTTTLSNVLLTSTPTSTSSATRTSNTSSAIVNAAAITQTSNASIIYHPNVAVNANRENWRETKEVIVKVIEPKIVKNKATLFRSPNCTKATSCRPLTNDVQCQTDFQVEFNFKGESICPIPIPIPILVPVPIGYMQPLAFPLPLPVPIMIPAQRSSAFLQRETENKNSNENMRDEEANNFGSDLLTLPDELVDDSLMTSEESLSNDIFDRKRGADKHFNDDDNDNNDNVSSSKRRKT